MKGENMEKTAFGMNFEEFGKLYEECKGFNEELNKNHPTHEEKEPFVAFLKRGYALLNKNDKIRGKLV